MTDAQQREAARQFFYKWNGKGREDEDARSYWIDLLFHIFGMENVTDRVHLEAVREGRSSTIDLWLCEGNRKQYLKTVETNQVMLEVTAMRAKR